MKLKIILIHEFSLPVGALAALLLAGCAALPTTSELPVETDATAWQLQLPRMNLPAVLVLGEQHDAPEHQQWELSSVTSLAGQHRLAAVVLEMANAGHSTQALSRTASEAEVQAALDWKTAGWPWERYAAVVMGAVQAGVPVYGGNLPRAEMRSVMQQPQWDTHLPAAGWQRQRDAIHTGHCGLLPESQLAPMARIQLAKDARMAETAAALTAPGKTVLLIAGRGHVLRGIGIPTWLPATTRTSVAVAEAAGAEPTLASDRDWLIHTPAIPPQDHCAELRGRWQSGASGAAAAPAMSSSTLKP